MTKLSLPMYVPCTSAVRDDYRTGDNIALASFNKIYCMHMYGSKLWNLNSNYVDDFIVAWKKVKRRIKKLPCINAHKKPYL